MARDHSKTGTNTGSDLSFIKILAKEGKFELPDGSMAESFTGYLDKVDMEFRDAISEHRIPARWEIKLTMEADLGEGPKKYSIGLSSHWQNPIMPNLVNGISGAMAKLKSWEDPDNRLVRIYLKLRDRGAGKEKICSATAFESGERNAPYLPNLFEWNDAARAYDGVPDDLVEATLFWVGQAYILVKATGGSITGADKATVKFPGMPTGVTTAGAVKDASGILDRAQAYLAKNFEDSGDFENTVKKTFQALKKQNATDAQLAEFAKWCTDYGVGTTALLGQHVTPTGEIKDNTADAPVSTTPAPDDDLPF